MRPFALLLALIVAAALPGPVLATSAEEQEAAVARLDAELATLDADPALADLGAMARLQARAAIAAARDAKRRERDHRAFIAGLRVRAARVAAEAELLSQQSAQLDRERDEIMIEASRLEAERARRDAERLELQALARQERAERAAAMEAAAQAEALELASAETAQARKLAEARAREAELARREAELAAEIAADDIVDAVPPPKRRDGGRDVYTLDGGAFGSGSATLTAQAQASLRELAAMLRGGDGRISVEGHTDGQGETDANLALSRQRAESVRRALEDAGLPGARLEATGWGEGKPVADDATAEGRARNRRVEIIVN
jgi:outer membrane protein OmpA-like peptidoglycan-associated protein